MKISTQIRKRKLEKINSPLLLEALGKANNKCYYPVLLRFSDRKYVYTISTNLTTTNKKMRGFVFNDCDQSALQNAEKTKKLTDLAVKCQQCAQMYVGVESVLMVKERMKKIVRGVPMEREPTLTEYMQMYIEEMVDHKGTRSIYERCMALINEYCGNNGSKCMLDFIDDRWLKKYEKHLAQEKHLSINTINQHMRCIRAIFNFAKKKKMVTQNYPFDFYTAPSEEIRPFVMSAQDLADLRDFPCEDAQKKEYIDMFMLQFYLCGINIGDISNLTEIKRGRVDFVRQKNQTRSVIRWTSLPVTKQALEIINRYRGKEYLINVKEKYTDYKDYDRHMNRQLKKIGLVRIVPDKVGKMRKEEYHPMFPEICSMTARRSFATIAAKLGFSDMIIGKCLGHAKNKLSVTQRYIYLDYEDVDNCVNKVMEYVNSFKGRSKDEIFEEIALRDGLDSKY